MTPNRPHCGAFLCALHSFFLVFLRMPACALCTPQNRPVTVAALGFLRFTFATPDYKLCVSGHDKGVSRNIVSRAALVARPFAKTSKECLFAAPNPARIGKCFLRSIVHRLKSLTYKPPKKEAF